MAKNVETSTLRKIKEELWNMPMFHMMLGGRELFHSNFLGWIFEKHTSDISSFFDLSTDNVQVQREKHNLDLIISSGQQSIFIENKFKAIVNEEQLRKYSEKIFEGKNFKNNKKILIILSPDEFELIKKTMSDLKKFDRSCWQEPCQRWYHLSYRDLLDHLEKSAVPYVNDYVNMTKKTLDFMDYITANDRDHGRIYWFDVNDQFKEQDDIARTLKLQDMLQKRRAERLQTTLWERLEGQISGIQKKDVRTDFTRTEPLAEAFIDLDKELSVGIQIQGHVYKRCLLIKRELAKKKNGYDSKTVDRLKDKAKEFQKFGWFRCKDEKVFFRGTEESRPVAANTDFDYTKGYQKYDDNFLYQWVKVGTGHIDIAPQNLIDIVVKDMNFAKMLIINSSPGASSN